LSIAITVAVAVYAPVLPRRRGPDASCGGGGGGGLVVKEVLNGRLLHWGASNRDVDLQSGRARIMGEPAIRNISGR
jgi:hypothetical protein